MRVFVTGASGFIGSRIVRELIDTGHQVLGLARNDSSAKAIAAAGADAHRGDLTDLESLKSGAAKSDAVIHLAFNHDFSTFAANCEDDRRVIEAMGSVLAGSNKLLIVTSGTGMGQSQAGRLITENDPPVSSKVVARAATEEAAAAVAAKGVRVAVVRLPQVHDTVKQGLVTYAVQIARQKGVSAYVSEGKNRWPAVHVTDTAHLYCLALEKTNQSATYHAVAEEGVPIREIAETLGRGLKVPVVSISPDEAPKHFGWLAHFVGWDIAASSKQTREQLGWNPTGPSLITDLQNMNYSQS
jgi:nucleoside-diphosphate-sugar epimerase